MKKSWILKIELDIKFIKIKDNKCPNKANNNNIYLDTYTEYPEISQEWSDSVSSLVIREMLIGLKVHLMEIKPVYLELDGFKKKTKRLQRKIQEFCYKEGQRGSKSG